MASGYTAKEVKVLMRKVLEEYLKCGVIGQACTKAGIRKKLHNEWMEKYPRYKELYEEIKEKFVDGLESIAIERAKEKSDSLLMMLLKAHRREIYGDRSELNVKNENTPITLVFAEGMLTPEEKKMLEGTPSEPVEE